ncbi:MAG: TIGR01777 family protein [Armatimonadetes bacterium]|nr:TIGR01777 family protein [Armatimonadota bacterium]
MTHPRFVVTGASGLIGSHLVAALVARGAEVIRLVRRSPLPEANEILWQPEAGTLDSAALAGATAVVHLAGVSLTGGPWTPGRRQAILQSRVRSTRLLAQTLAGLPPPRPALISASAIGYYGDAGTEPVTEDSAPGSGFLAGVCQAWEAAADAARQAGVRVVHLRFGVVLSRDGGALPRFVAPTRLGLGAVLGSGRQVMSWVAMADAIGAILHCLDTPSLQGPVNVTAPEVVTNAEFMRALGQVLHRPVMLRVPGTFLELAMGDLARELLLSSAHVVPRKLPESGYQFRFPTLREALQAELGAR